MQGQQELDAKLTTVQDALKKLGTDMTQSLKNIEDKLNAAGNPVDLTAEVTALGNIADAISSLDSTIVAADPGPSATDPTPTTGAPAS